MKKILFGLLLLAASIANAATFPYFTPATGVLKGSATSYVTTAATAADIYGLWSGTCNSGTFLGGDGTCRAATTTSANPSASVGLSAVNGTATTFMTSDSAPALDVSISPTWTGTHTFSNQNKLTLGAMYVDQSAPSTPASGRIDLYSLNSGSSAQSQLTTLDPNGVTLSLGFEQHMVVYNQSGSTIPVGELVYISGSHATTPTVALAQANSATTLPAVGFTQYAIPNNSYGQIHVSGTLAATTTGFSNGDTLYVDPAVAGGLTNVAPNASGQYVQQVGVVTNGGVGAGAGRFQFLFLNPSQAVRSVATGGTGVTALSSLTANPSTSVGLSTVNGSASTFMRSDGAPALSQSIAPTWTGTHIFNGASTTGTGTAGISLGQSSNHGSLIAIDTNGGTNAKLWQRLTSATTLTERLVNDAFSTVSNMVVWTRSGVTLSDTSFGNATDNPTAQFLGTGLVSAGGGIQSKNATAGIGYASGAGGTVSQTSSRTTTVVCSKVSCQITMFSAAGSTTPATFTVTDTAVAATDTIVVNQASGTNLYELFVTAVTGGSFNITFFTTGGTATDAPVINFNVIKGSSN